MLPTRREAEELLRDAALCNPGPWENHSRVAAHCAEKIAAACSDMNSDKAYVLGLLHDIGRKFGKGHLRHVSDGYKYMMSLGFDEVAKICMTHSFQTPDINEYVGNRDVSENDMTLIVDYIASVECDDYDKLIQLCDALADSDGVVDIEERMDDVERRYGHYPVEKRYGKRALKSYFERKTGRDIYDLAEKSTYKP